jgi:uncharacterized membrane protein YgaE (UPF0421/DUF939 family)
MTAQLRNRGSTSSTTSSPPASETFSGIISEYGDVELGRPVETLQQQSHRLSGIISARTELHYFDHEIPDPPKEITVEEETSGLRYWSREISTAKEHGGDYKSRVEMAFRTALGSFTTFAILVLPQQQIMGAVWIGNIFMHCNIQKNFGSSFTSVIGFGRSIVITTTCAWPVAYVLGQIPVFYASIMFPFVVFILSFMIMSCPQLASRNLMILVMYIVVATPVRDDFELWEPFGLAATYLMSLVVALLMNVIPVPNFALRSTHSQLQRLQKDLTMLLLESKTYSNNTGIKPEVSRGAVASIELMHTRITATVKDLSAKLPATRTELGLMCKGRAAKDLAEWVDQSEKLLQPLKMLRTSLMQRVLGEEYDIYSQNLREAKIIINTEIGPARDRMVDAMIAAVAVCHAWADPSEHRTVLPDVQGELRVALRECRSAFHRAMGKATEKLGDHPRSNVPIFAHLTRRMSSFSALFDLGDSMLDYLEKHSWEAEEMTADAGGACQKGFGACFCEWCCGVIAFCETKWLWYNPDNFRLALKTSVGMVLASMFVSVPYLWDISQPFGVWPGLTIASVSLATTGSSFHKASDRLFGTLLAAAYALLVSDLFPGNNDAVKIPEITVFTFVVIYLRNSEHAYKYTYAATSIGSMLYGSVKNEFNIAGYIPKRIELIFVGVVIFSVVELLLFPRSSRKIVEGLGFQFILSMREFLKQATECNQRMEEYVEQTKAMNTNKDDSTAAEYSHVLFDEVYDPFHLKKLGECHAKLKAQSAKLRKELDSALEEPNMGLSLSLHPHSFRGMIREQSSCEVQALMMLHALNRLAGYYQEEGHPIREIVNWPQIHRTFLQDTTATMGRVCDWLTTVYPDGRIRAQNGNSVRAVAAASSFRGFEEVRLRIISEWSRNYQEFVKQQGFEKSDPIAIMTLGITTTFILELCRHMQLAGKHLEEVAYRYPAPK